MAKAGRTTHRSSTGKKVYAVRDSNGRFKDIQTYERAHGMDVKRTAAIRDRHEEEEGEEEVATASGQGVHARPGPAAIGAST